MIRHRPTDYHNVSLWTAAAIGAISFVGGLVYASNAMRLRDRERLRNACSRIKKHLVVPQRMSLGPAHLKPANKKGEKESILVVGAGAYGTLSSIPFSVQLVLVLETVVVVFLRGPFFPFFPSCPWIVLCWIYCTLN
jgi:hypothetical protein